MRDSTTINPKCRSYAKLIAGSLHDDCLLLHEPLVLEQFPSPYTARFATRSSLPADSAAVHVVASVILDRLIGLDITRKVTVPRTAKLQTGLPAASGQQSDAAYTLTQQQQQQQQQNFASSAPHGSGQQHNADLLQQGAACPPGQLQQLSHASANQMPKTTAAEVADGHKHARMSTSLPAAGWAETCHSQQQPGQGVLMETAGQGKGNTAAELGAGEAAASGQGHGTLRQGRLEPLLSGQTGSGQGPISLWGCQEAARNGAGTLGGSQGPASNRASTLGVPQGTTASKAGTLWGSQGPAPNGADIQEAAANEAGTPGGSRGGPGGSRWVPGNRVASCTAGLLHAPWQCAEGGKGASATTTADAAKKTGKATRRKLVHTISLPHAPSSNGLGASHANASMHSQGSERLATSPAYGGTEQVQGLALTDAGIALTIVGLALTVAVQGRCMTVMIGNCV